MRSNEALSIVPRNKKDLLKVLLIAGLPSTLIVALLSVGDERTLNSHVSNINSGTRSSTRTLLDDSFPVLISEDLIPSSNADISGSLKDDGILVNSGQIQGAHGVPGDIQDRSSTDLVSQVERELDQNQFDGQKITFILDQLSWEVAGSRVSPVRLKVILERVLSEIEIAGGKWRNNADAALVVQGVAGVLARSYRFDENGNPISHQSPPMLALEDFKRFDERVKIQQRLSLSDLAKSRIDEIFELVSDDPNSRYDRLLGSFLFADLVKLVQLLKENGNSGEFIAAKSKVLVLLEDMVAEYRRLGRNNELNAVSARKIQIEGL